MRFYFRTGRHSGISVGIVGAFILGVMLATVWFYLAIFAAAVIVLAVVLQVLYRGGRWLVRRRR